jgi:hypothetical protein
MNRHHHRMSATIGLAILLSTAVWGISCEQPPLLCETASGPYIMKYFPKDPANDCLMLPGEFVGMNVYNPPKGDDREIDASKATIAIQAMSMGVLADDARDTANATDPNAAHTQYSLGDYSTRPDANDFCSASNLAAAEQDIPQTAYTDADGNPAVYPETRLVHEWNDVRLYMTFATPGNAATGEVTMTREIKDPGTGNVDTCTVTYIASGLFPPVGCEATDAMGQGTGMPDDTRCCANADLAAGRPYGSRIHPDFRTKCDPVLLQCVLDWSPGETFPPLGGNPACNVTP